MAVYKYSYYDLEKIRYATLEANDEHDAQNQLFEQGIQPLGIQKKTLLSFNLSIHPRVSTDDLLLFSRLLSTMVGAGLSILDSLQLICKQLKNKRLVKIIQSIATDIENGLTISDAFGQHQNVFGQIYCHMIRAGEKSGQLDVFLKQIESLLYREQSIKRNIKAAIFYPLFLLGVTVVMTLVVIFFVVPKFETIYANSGNALPGATLIVIDFSRMLMTWSFWIKTLLVMVVSMQLFIWGYRKIEHFHYMVDYVAIKLPVIGKVIDYGILSQIFIVFAYLIRFGISIIDTIEIIQKGTNNHVYKRALSSAAQAIDEGKTVSSVFENSQVFSVMVCQMLTIGEQSGQFEHMVQKIADYYNELFSNLVKTLNTIIEPVMILIVASMIGFLLFAMYLPIFNLGNTLL